MVRTSFIVVCLLLFPVFFFGQQGKDYSFGGRLGVIGCYDYAFNGPDKLMKTGIGRKASAGICLSNKDHDFIFFAGGGIKGFKIDLYSPDLQDGFVADVKANYQPVQGYNEDSVIGAHMYYRGNKGFGDSYALYLHAGFLLNTKFRPSLNLYSGWDTYLLHDDAFEHFEDPEHGDIDYVGLSARFYEIKAGITFPLARLEPMPLSMNLNIGYKWLDYGNIKFNDTDLSKYTTGEIAKKYNRTGKFTVSLMFMIWSNWWPEK